MQTIQSQLNILAKCANHLNNKIHTLEEIQHPTIKVTANETETTLEFENEDKQSIGTFTFEYMGTTEFIGIKVDGGEDDGGVWIKSDGSFTTNSTEFGENPKIYDATKPLDNKRPDEVTAPSQPSQ